MKKMENIRKNLYLVLICLSLFSFTGCFADKNSPISSGDWIMQNVDQQGQQYFHHMILGPGNKVMLRVSYFDSTNIMVWRGTYKYNSKKISFKFADCSRFENGENIGQYSDKRLVNFYNGEYFYSLGLVGDTEESKVYHLQLIRPKNQLTGDTVDIFGNYFQDFVKTVLN